MTNDEIYRLPVDISFLPHWVRPGYGEVPPVPRFHAGRSTRPAQSACAMIYNEKRGPGFLGQIAIITTHTSLHSRNMELCAGMSRGDIGQVLVADLTADDRSWRMLPKR